MSKPMYAMIIPPTMRSTSNEMSKMAKTFSPASADASRIIRILSATLTAADRLCGGASSAVEVKNMEPHTTGLMTAKTVTTA
jgi:hypothetical protein